MSKVPYYSLEDVRRGVEREYEERVEMNGISTKDDTGSNNIVSDLYNNSKNYIGVPEYDDVLVLQKLQETLKVMKKEQKLMFRDISYLQKELDVANEKLEKMGRVTEKEVRNILRHYREKVNELVENYGTSAKRKIQSNLQGYIFKKYGVNAYESLLMIHEPYVVEDIMKWKPSKELEAELNRYRLNQQKLEI